MQHTNFLDDLLKQTYNGNLISKCFTLTSMEHRQQASSPHPCLHRSVHIQNHEEDPLTESHLAHPGREPHEDRIGLNKT